MARAPDYLTLEGNRDMQGHERRPIVRWVLLTLLAAFAVAGLANAFGQRPATDVAESAAARLEVYSPRTLRGGLIYESRFRIDAREEIEDATLVLDPGWFEGMTINTGEPAPIGEASRDGRVALELGHVPKGQSHSFFLQSQVNPTNIGRRPADVELNDGETLLLHLDRTVTIFP
jgi:hypothetical protein